MSPSAGNSSAGELRQQCARIVQSPSFARSKSLVRLLTYLLEAHIENRPVKEYLLGSQVFDRGEDFDPAIDNIVRVQAGNLRTKLKAYYDGPGIHDPLVIRLPAGGYALSIEERPVAVAVVEAAAVPVEKTAPHRHRRWLLVAAVMLLIVVVVATLLYRGRGTPWSSVAVLPFSNLDADPSVQVYADGLTEDLIEIFARTPGTSVTARTSVWSYRNQTPRFSEIRNALRVDSMVEGSVRRNGNRLRILVRVVDTADGHSVWSGEFEPTPAEIPSAQQQIGREVSAALRLPAASTEAASAVQDPELYELCRRGRAQWFLSTVDGAHQAISLAAQALVKNPAYAPAYVVMAGAYTELVVAGRADTLQNWQHVKEMAMKAIELEPTNAEAHMLLAGPRAWLDWDYPAAEREYRRALELAPGNAVVHQYFASFLSAFGRFGEAGPHIALTRKLDPLNPLAIWIDARLAYWSGDYQRSAKVLDQLRAKYPTYALINNLIPRVWPRVGRTDEAIAVLERVARVGNGLDAYGLLGFVLAQSGRTARARQVAAELEAISRDRFVPATSLAFVYIGLGENAKAIAALSKACDERSLRTAYMVVDPMFETLRPEPEFQKLLQRVGLAK